MQRTESGKAHMAIVVSAYIVSIHFRVLGRDHIHVGHIEYALFSTLSIYNPLNAIVLKAYNAALKA